MKKETGITLVSLVVTIIILIILAGISINILVGDNGVITKAQQAKENTLLAQEEEAKQLNQLYSQLNYIGGNAGDIDGDAVDKLLNFKKVIAVAITNEGVSTQETDSAEVMASHIGKILQERTKDATATADDILEGKTAYINGKMIRGTHVNEAERLYLYQEGDECISITGGWASALKKNINNMTLFSNNEWVYATTMNQIDISEYKYLCADLSSTMINHSVVGVSTIKSNVSSYNNCISLYGTTRNTVKMNIENLQGSLYGLVGASSCTATFYNIWLEK